MKRIFQFVIVTVLAAQALVLGQGPDAMKLLADVRAALGGEEKLAAVKSVAVEGRLTQIVRRAVVASTTSRWRSSCRTSS